MWFNYGNVNGFDFWNNSDAIKPEGKREVWDRSGIRRRSSQPKAALTGESWSVESLWVTGTRARTC